MILDADSNLATHSYNLRTVRAYHLKEAFQQLLDYGSPFAAPQHWTAWLPILPWKGCRRFGIRLYCVRRPSLRDFSA